MAQGDGAATTFGALLVNVDHVTSVPLNAALGEQGFDLTYVSSSIAYETLDENVSSFDALVVDVDIGGITGFEIAHYARLRNPAVSVIFLSGAHRDSVEKFGVTGAAHVTKPFDPELLVLILRGLAAR